MLKLSSPLDPCIADLANLYRVELVPLSLVELLVKVWNELGMDKVQEGIANITIILSVNICTL